MSQTDDWETFDPCPECGSRKLRQLVQQWEDLTVNEMGDIRNIGYQDELDVLEIRCGECDEVLFEAEE